MAMNIMFRIESIFLGLMNVNLHMDLDYKIGAEQQLAAFTKFATKQIL